MATVDKVVVELEAKLDRYTGQVAAAQRSFDKGVGTMQQTAARAEKAIVGSFRNIAGAIGVTLGGAALVAAARGFLAFADAAKQLEAQLKLATAATGSYAQAQADVREIAAATRSDLNATGSLYATIARNAKELGLAQSQVARVTTSVSQAFLISGSSAVEAAQGTRQLLQGLQAGALRGDEFNSVMESAPRLARLLADSLGVPIGQLRAMAEAGELTAARLTTALGDTRFTAALDEEFKRLPVTFDQAMTLVNNAAQETFGAFDAGGQFSTALANFITQGTDGMADIGSAAEEAGIDTRAAFEGLGDAFTPLVDGALRAFGIIDARAASTRERIGSLLGVIDSFANFDTRIENYVNARSASLANALQRGGVTSRGGLTDRYLRSGQQQPLSDLRGRFERGFDRSARSGRASASDRANERSVVNNSQGFGRFLNEPNRFDLFGNSLVKPTPTAVAGKAAAKRKGPKGPSAEQLAARAERERLAQERDDAAFGQDLARINEQILAAKRAQTVALEAVAALEIQEIEAERERVNAGIRADVTQKRLTEAQAAQLIEANNQLASLRTQTVQLKEQERLRAEALQLARADAGNELDLARAAAQLAETRGEQKAAALRILELQYQMERAELEGVIASQDATAAQKEIARRRLALLGKLEEADREGVERQNESPGQRYKRELDRKRGSLNDELEEVQVRALQRLEDSLTRATTKALGLKGALGEIVGELIRIAVQRAIIGPLADALFGAAEGGGGSGAGGLLTSLGSIFTGGRAPPRASGGHVNAGRIYRVNEGGVEGFQPAGSGKIIPLGRMPKSSGGGVTVVQSFTLDARYGITTPELLRRVNTVASERAAQAGAAAYDASQKAVPERLGRFQKLGT